MVTILPLPPELLRPLCQEAGVDSEEMVWGYAAADQAKMAGYCIVSAGEPCKILRLEAADKYIADGLLRKALSPFYESGVREYEFDSVPDCPITSDYIIIGRGSLEKLFRPRCKS
jgi:hypothetical protein